jgi:hypothetical protein
MDVAVCVLSLLAGARIMQIVGEVPMDFAVLAWGILVSCIVATGILTGEWGQLFSRVVQAGGVRTPNYRSLRLFLSGAFLSLVGSAYSWFLVDHQTGLFIGLWVPSILALGALLNAAPGGGNRERP